MKKVFRLIVWAVGVVGFIHSLNLLSYHLLKTRILRRQKWDLNVCCGKTDGGGINADIRRHAQVPNLVIVDVYHLPFAPGRFNSVLSSHTIEHVDDPLEFYTELRRVGRSVTLVTPPLWDLSAAFNVLEHKWLYLSMHTEHDHLPRFTRLPLAASVQGVLGQRIKA